MTNRPHQKHYSIAILLTCISMLSVTARQPNKADNTTYISIDPTALNEQQQLFIYNQLTKHQQFARTNEMVTSGKTMFSKVIREKYNLFNAGLEEKLAQLNSKAVKSRLEKGTTIFLPNLPAIPEKSNNDSITQLIDFKNQIVQTLKVNDITSDDTQLLHKSNYDINEARYWTIRFDNSEEALNFINTTNSLAADNHKMTTLLYEEEPSQISYKLPFDTLNKTSAEVDNSDIMDLSYLNVDDFKTLYILDVFNKSNCNHGDMVLDVVASMLQKYNLPKTLTANKVVAVPINYFDNKNAGNEIIKNYYEKVANDFERAFGGKLVNDLNKLKKQCNDCLPEYYLSVLFKWCYATQAGVISSSFSAQSYINDLYPRVTPNNSIMLITSGTNDPGQMVEDLFTNASAGEIIPKIEPIYSYYNNSTNGPLIVGSKNSINEIYGMKSRTGSGVSVMGHATGWKGKYIKYNDVGNSFATPEIATKLFIAQAFFTHHKLNKLTSSEIKKRLLLATDLEPSFIGQIGSAGIPNLRKMLTTADGYLQTIHGNILETRLANPANSYIINENGIKIPIGRNGKDHVNKISGLYFTGNEVYAFYESDFVWTKITATNISLSLIINNKEQRYGLNEIHQIKHLVILNN